MNNFKIDIISQIQSVVKELEIKHYRITEEQKETVELYFIKKSMDMRRRNHVTDISITVYRDFESNGKKMRGSSTASLYVTMNYEELKSAIQSAYYAASFVQNAYYDIPSGEYKDCITLNSELMNHSLEENAMLLASALYEPDTSSDVFINSSEFFSSCNTVRIVNSQGIDVSYKKSSISGEFVVQCISPNDVETFQDFKYNDLELEAIKSLANTTLEVTKSRALATTAPKTGLYNVIISDVNVKSLCSYYTDRACSAYIYPGYSTYKVGTNVQGDNVKNELLNIKLKATVPYSIEGIPMSDRPLIENGVLKSIQGHVRFAYYLGIEATGYYDCMEVDNGSMSMDEMKKEPYLHIVNFSDFQMDALTGDFGGEIRLAFYYDGKTVTPVTGCSITANLTNYQDQLIFSKERQVRSDFEGPKAMLFKGVQLSGV